MSRKSLTEANADNDGTEKKAPRAIKRVSHVFYKASTNDGSPVPANVTVEVVTILTDARKVVEFMDSDESAGLKRFKYETISTPRDADADAK
jgi:hypothetical protein